MERGFGPHFIMTKQEFQAWATKFGLTTGPGPFAAPLRGPVRQFFYVPTPKKEEKK